MNLFNPGGRSRLDAPERAEWQKPDAVVAALGLRPDMAVADIGAGTGYFALRIAGQVGPAGRVYAVDLQQTMLDALAARIAETGSTNVVALKSGPSDIPLPDRAVDIAFTVNVAHEFPDLDATLRECARILKPGGRLAVVDWKPEPTPVGPPLDLRISPDRVADAARAAGLSPSGSLDLLPYQFFLFFDKR